MSTPQNMDSRMTKYPVVATKDMTVPRALQLMALHHIRHLPVTDAKRVVGVVSERDLVRIDPYLWTKPATVKDIMVQNVYAVSPQTPLIEVTRKMGSEKFGCAVVVDAHHNILGIFTTTDALKILTDLLGKEDEKERELMTIGRYFEWDASWGE